VSTDLLQSSTAYIPSSELWSERRPPALPLSPLILPCANISFRSPGRRPPSRAIQRDGWTMTDDMDVSLGGTARLRSYVASSAYAAVAAERSDDEVARPPPTPPSLLAVLRRRRQFVRHEC